MVSEVILNLNILGQVKKKLYKPGQLNWHIILCLNGKARICHWEEIIGFEQDQSAQTKVFIIDYFWNYLHQTKPDYCFWFAYAFHHK